MASDEPRTIERWDAEAKVVVGDPIDVLWEDRTRDVEAIEAGLLPDEELVLFSAVPLEEGLTYWYDGAVYTAEEAENDTVGTTSLQSRYILRRVAE